MSRNSYGYDKLWRLERSRGVLRLRDASRAREHIHRLVDAGMSQIAIAEAAGVCEETLRRVRKGHYVNIRRDFESRLLAIPAAPESRGQIDRTGSIRRIRALQVLGWTVDEISTRAGVSAKSVTASTGPLRVRIALAIAAVYDQLWDAPPPQGPGPRWVRGYAARRGWAPPLAWDDDTIDDPTAQPDLGANPQHVHVDDVAWLLRCGLHGQALADRLGIKRDSVEAVCRRAGRNDLARWARTGIEPHRGAA